MRYIKAFARFWWDFIVGDDWHVAAAIAGLLALTWALTRAGYDVWWLLPLGIVLVLAESVRREAGRKR